MSALSANPGYRKAAISLGLGTVVATALLIAYHPVVAFWTVALSLLAVALLWPMKNFLPVALFVVIWFVPAQTAPGGVLQDFRMLRWVSHVVIPLVFLLYLSLDLIKDKRWRFTPFSTTFAAIFGIIIVSAIYNQSGLLDTVSGLLIYLRYPLFFLLLVNLDVPDRSILNVVWAFIGLTLLQIPEVLYRSLFLGIRGDAVSMTLGVWGHFALGVYILYFIALLTAHALAGRIRHYHFLLIAAFLFIAGVGEIKAVVVFSLPVILAVYLVQCRNFKKSFFTFLLIFALSCGALAVVFAFWESLAGDHAGALTDVYQFAIGFLGGKRLHELPAYFRFEQVRIILDMIGDSVGHFCLGLGPGSSLSGNFSGKPGVVSAALSHLIFDQVTTIQLVALLSDIGTLGLAAYLFLFYRIFRFALRLKGNGLDPQQLVLLHGFFGIMVIYAVFGPLYNLVWRLDVSNYLFWALLAYLYRIRPEGRNEPQEALP